MFKVYLAGPIAGLNYQEGQGWRDYVKVELSRRWEGLMYFESDIKAYSPLRGKEFLDDGNIIGSGEESDHPLTTARGITARDGNDVRTCDLLFVNVDGVTRISGGTAWELGVAWALNKIVVMVASNADNPYLKHLILSSISAFVVPSLDEGIVITKGILLT